MGQLLLGVFHPVVVFVEFRRVLLGGEGFVEGDLNALHLLVVKILTFQHFLAPGNGVDVGGDDVTQLAQPLPVQSCRQLLLLNGHLPLEPLAEIADGFAHRLALLPHGIPPVPGDIEAVQKLTEGLGLPALAVLADGAEGVLFFRKIGPGKPQVLPEEQVQLFPQSLGIRLIQPGIDIPGGKQRRLPAHQGAEAAVDIHQPLAEYIRAGGFQGQGEALCRFLPGVQLVHRLRALIVEPRQGRAGAFVQADAPQAVDDPPVGTQKIEIAGPAHQLGNQRLFHMVAHLVDAVKGEPGQPLHGGLLHRHQPSAQKVLAQQHTEHGGLSGIFRGTARQMEPGRGGIGGQQEPAPALFGFQVQQHRIPGGLVDLVDPGRIRGFPDLVQHRGEKIRVKCHKAPPLP